MLLGVVAQAQNFAITATTEAAVRKNIVKGNAANYGFGMINDTLKLIGLTTRNVIFTGSTSKNDIGLGNVDNTSDANKPVSTATQTALNLKQNQLNGTGFVKASGTTISYDNSTYLTTSSAASTYLPINNPTATGILTAPTIANSLGATFATSSGSIIVGNVTAQTGALIAARRTGNSFEFGHSNQAGYQSTLGANAGNGHSFLALNSEAGTNTNTFRTRGLAGRVIVNNIDFNRLDFQRVTSASADNQTPVIDLSIFSTGRVGINTTTDAGYLLDVNGTARFVNGVNLATTSGNVGIGTTAPAASAILDITSTTQGVLFPRLTTDQINAIASPANGLTVYNTDLSTLCFYHSGAWEKVSHSAM
jgi:hypothetical protein